MSSKEFYEKEGLEEIFLCYFPESERKLSEDFVQLVIIKDKYYLNINNNIYGAYTLIEAFQFLAEKYAKLSFSKFNLYKNMLDLLEEEERNE